MSDRNYELEAAGDDYHEHRLENEPVRYRIELFIDRTMNKWKRSSWRRDAMRVFPWARRKEHDSNIPF